MTGTPGRCAWAAWLIAPSGSRCRGSGIRLTCRHPWPPTAAGDATIAAGTPPPTVRRSVRPVIATRVLA